LAEEGPVETSRKKYNSLMAPRRRNNFKIERDYLFICGSRRMVIIFACSLDADALAGI
jgi:hypothetical protein